MSNLSADDSMILLLISIVDAYIFGLTHPITSKALKRNEDYHFFMQLKIICHEPFLFCLRKLGYNKVFK